MPTVAVLHDTLWHHRCVRALVIVQERGSVASLSLEALRCSKVQPVVHNLLLLLPDYSGSRLKMCKCASGLCRAMALNFMRQAVRESPKYELDAVGASVCRRHASVAGALEWACEENHAPP
eukprot:6464027-Amphidinium_carterae.2